MLSLRRPYRAGDALATGMAGWFRDGKNVNIVLNADLDAAIEYTIVLQNTSSVTINGTAFAGL